MCGLLIVVLFPVVEPGVQALELGFSSCGARAQLPQGMWNLLGTGIEPVSAALTSRFLTTELPGKSLQWVLAAGERLDATLNTVWVIRPTWGLIDKTARYVNLKNKD